MQKLQSGILLWKKGANKQLKNIIRKFDKDQNPTSINSTAETLRYVHTQRQIFNFEGL